MTAGRPPIRPGRGKRAESEFERKLREAREQQPTTARCAVEGCAFAAHGTAVEVLELARQHRVAEHPELRERGIRPQPKTPPVKHPSVQTEEDKKIVRDLAARQRQGGQRGPRTRSPQSGRQRLLTPEMIDEAIRRHVDGRESLLRIARERYVAWGFRNPKSCAMSLTREFRERGVAILDRSETRSTTLPSRLTPARFEACKRLYLAGISTTAIGDLVWDRYGYANASSAGNTVARALTDAGIELTKGRPRILIPELNRREAVEIIEAAEQLIEAAA